MLKKSIHGFSHDLDEVNSSRSHKLLDFSSLAIWQSIHGLHSQGVFNTLLKKDIGWKTEGDIPFINMGEGMAKVLEGPGWTCSPSGESRFRNTPS